MNSGGGPLEAFLVAAADDDEPGPAAFGPLLYDLTDAERGELAVRLRHVRELLTVTRRGRLRRRSQVSRGLSMIRRCR